MLIGKFFKFKNEIAPINFQSHPDYLVVGDAYIRIYLVRRFPSEFGFGLLNVINADETISEFVHITYITEVTKKSRSRAITKEKKKLRRLLEKTTNDEQKRADLMKDIDELDLEMLDAARSNNKFMEVTMLIRVMGDSLETLKDHCEQVQLSLEHQGFELDLLDYIQEQLYKLSTPLWASNDIDQTLRYNWGVDLSSMSTAALWPYHYEEVRDPEGILLGIELYRRGLIQWDPFLWINNPDIASAAGINSGNWAIFGAIGSGKTTSAYKPVLYLIMNQIKTIWIDPEGTNEDIVKKYHGQYIQFGLPGNYLNVLDLRPISVDNDEDKEKYQYDTKLAINAAIRDLKEIIKVYHNNDPIASSAVDVLDDVVIRAYEKKGITAERFDQYTYDDYPILEDVVDVLNEIVEERSKQKITNDKKLEQYTNLQVKLEPMIKADGQFFNGHTNITFAMDKEAKLLGICTKILDTAGERIRNSIFYLITRYAEGIIFSRENLSAAVFEEAHRFINLPYCLERLENMWLRDRKYRSICGLIMQEVSPFTREGSHDGKAIIDYSRAIFNNTVYKLFMNLDKPAVDDLVNGNLIDLNDNETEAILNFKQGQGLFQRGRNKYAIYVYPHVNELKELEKNR